MEQNQSTHVCNSNNNPGSMLTQPWHLQKSFCGYVQHFAFVKVVVGKCLSFCEAVGNCQVVLMRRLSFVQLSWRWSPSPRRMQCPLRAWDFSCLTTDSVQEDRIVPCDEEEAVVFFDGTALTVNSPLRALRADCESFGNVEASRCV